MRVWQKKATAAKKEKPLGRGNRKVEHVVSTMLCCALRGKDESWSMAGLRVRKLPSVLRGLPRLRVDPVSLKWAALPPVTPCVIHSQSAIRSYAITSECVRTHSVAFSSNRVQVSYTFSVLFPNTQAAVFKNNINHLLSGDKIEFLALYNEGLTSPYSLVNRKQHGSHT